MHSTKFSVVFFLAASLALGCTPTVDPLKVAGPDFAPDPGATGPFAVGITTFTLVDPFRVDPRTGTGQRPLKLDIWYPADDAARDQPFDNYDLKAEVPEAQQHLVADVASNPAPQAAVRDALPRRDQEGFPVIIFSHGNGGMRGQSFSYTAHLASHGYVVISPDHVGNTFFDLAAASEPAEQIAAAAVDRPLDVSAILDGLEDGILAPELLAGIVDLRRVGITGHSFGGYTSLVAASPTSKYGDPRIQAAVPVTPLTSALALVSAPVEDVEIPVFYVGATADQTLDYTDETLIPYEAHTGPKGMAGLKEAGHFSFSEACTLDLSEIAAALGVEARLLAIFEDGCAPENMPVERAHLLNNYYGAAWFNIYLRGSVGTAEAWLAEGPADVEYDVQLAGAGR